MKKWKKKLGVKPLPPAESRKIAYSKRNQLIRDMGYANYAAYLKSALWRSIRPRVLTPESKCFACGGLPTQVHHACYRREDLDGTDLRRLYPVCRGCHECIEFRNRDGEKLSVTQATAKMRQLRTRRAKTLAR